MSAALTPSSARPSPPWHAYLLLLAPRRVEAMRARVQKRLPPGACPSLWQLELGVLRMWWRVLFRSETVGNCSDQPVRQGRRARWLQWKPLRGPVLLWERAIAPWDMTGLLSSQERIIRHLLGAHHDRRQCAYDLALLELRPGALEELERRVAAVVSGADPRAEWLRDLAVYEGYHENLLAVVRAWRRGEPVFEGAEAHDPDVSFGAWLQWCARQPNSPRSWWAAVRAGRGNPTDGWAPVR
jgi:hypothetical protein